jgi:DNA-binding transcriptional MerR regulator
VSSSSTATLTIQQMAARSGFSEHTLRYYEGIGLIGPVQRDESSRQRELAATRLRLAYVQAKVDLWQARVDADEPREQESKAVSRRLAERLRASITA